LKFIKIYWYLLDSGYKYNIYTRFAAQVSRLVLYLY